MSCDVVISTDSKSGKYLNIIAKVFQNILNHPYEDKYTNLSMNRITKKLSKYPDLITILYAIGFCRSSNSKRLILDTNCSIKMKNFQSLCNQIFSGPTPSLQKLTELQCNYKAFSQLQQMGFDTQQSVKLLCNNNNNIDKCIRILTENNEHKSSTDAVNRETRYDYTALTTLQAMGFDKESSIKALCANNNNIMRCIPVLAPNNSSKQIELINPNPHSKIKQLKRLSVNGNEASFLWDFYTPLEVASFKCADSNVPFISGYHTIAGCTIYFEITPNGWKHSNKGCTRIWCRLYSLPNNVNINAVKIWFRWKCNDGKIRFQDEKEQILSTKYASSFTTDNYIDFSQFKDLSQFLFTCSVKVSVILNNSYVQKKPIASPDPLKKNAPFIWSFNVTEVNIFGNTKFGDVPFQSDSHIVNGCKFYFQLTPNGWHGQPKGFCMVWFCLEELGYRDSATIRFQVKCVVEGKMSFVSERQQELSLSKGCTWSFTTNDGINCALFEDLDKDVSFEIYIAVEPDFNPHFINEKHQNAADSGLLLSTIETDSSCEYSQELCCDGNVTKCPYVLELLNVMKMFLSLVGNMQYDCDAVRILDLFHHILDIHNQDDFYYIFEALGNCNIETCSCLNRIYGDKRTTVNNCCVNIDVCDLVTQQIIDKIHCFFKHSYAMGYRLKPKDNQIIIKQIAQNDNHCEQKENNQQKKPNVEMINNKIKSTRQILLQNKRFIGSQNKRCEKFKQLKLNTAKYYSFGQQFIYPDEKYTNAFNVLPKYKSLKIEMMHNSIFQMTTEQFNHEHTNAMKHFNSHYRKCEKTLFGVHLQHLLSLMIYCNYTELQYKFSTTYRDNIEEHN
eukprot:202704_1